MRPLKLETGPTGKQPKANYAGRGTISVLPACLCVPYPAPMARPDNGSGRPPRPGPLLRVQTTEAAN